MAHILDLPNEVLLKIVAEATYDGTKSRHSFRQHNKSVASQLSLVCRRFNDVLGYTIFHSYRIVLRMPSTFDPRRCFLTNTSLEQWDIDSICARLAHLERKAQFVRKVQIDDFTPAGSDWFPWRIPGRRVPRKPVCLPEELLQSLQTLSGLNFISFQGYIDERPAELPRAFWDWIAAVAPRELRLEMALTFPEDLQPISGLQSLSMGPYNEATARIVEMHRPPDLHLIYPRDVKGELHKFEPYAGLWSVQIEIRLDHRAMLPSHFFDFRSIPHAFVCVTIAVEEDGPDAEDPRWLSLARYTRKLFAEDLATSYDVYLVGSYVQFLRVRPGFIGPLRQLVPRGDF